MGSIIFVHGTGVRKESYQETFELIEGRLKQHAPGWDLVECLWGDEYGVKLHLKGGSIPKYRGEAAAADDSELMRWWALYHDPCCELRSLAAEGGARQLVLPGKQPAWKALDQTIRAIKPSQELRDQLAAVGLGVFWDKAFDSITKSTDYGDAVKNAFPHVGSFRKTLARAVFARATLDSMDKGMPVAPGDMRDAIIDRVVGELGGEDLGIREIKQAVLGGLKTVANIFAVGVMTTAAYSGMLSRGRITDESLPASGDILLYQTRGQAIRDFIKKRIVEATPPVYVLAHSLGGIACVDLLATEDLGVKGLMTAGSQTPLLYEMNCLTSLADGAPLPKHFPRWLNFYDRNDLLSYVGERVFPDRVKDIEIISRQPFPQAHSVYWLEPTLWKEIAGFIK